MVTVCQQELTFLVFGIQMVTVCQYELTLLVFGIQMVTVCQYELTFLVFGIQMVTVCQDELTFLDDQICHDEHACVAGEDVISAERVFPVDGQAKT